MYLEAASAQTANAKRRNRSNTDKAQPIVIHINEIHEMFPVIANMNDNMNPKAAKAVMISANARNPDEPLSRIC